MGFYLQKLKDLIRLKFVRTLTFVIESKGISCIPMIKSPTEKLHVDMNSKRFQTIQFLAALLATDEKVHIVVERTEVHGDNLGQSNFKFKQKIQSQLILLTHNKYKLTQAFSCYIQFRFKRNVV